MDVPSENFMLITAIQPYVYNKTSQVMVSYDNTKSMGTILPNFMSDIFLI